MGNSKKKHLSVASVLRNQAEKRILGGGDMIFQRLV